MSSLSVNPKTSPGHVLIADASRAASVTASLAGPVSQPNECRQRNGLTASAHRCAPPATPKKTCATSVAASPGVDLSHTLRRIPTIGSEMAPPLPATRISDDIGFLLFNDSVGCRPAYAFPRCVTHKMRFPRHSRPLTLFRDRGVYGRRPRFVA